MDNFLDCHVLHFIQPNKGVKWRVVQLNNSFGAETDPLSVLLAPWVRSLQVEEDMDV